MSNPNEPIMAINRLDLIKALTTALVLCTLATNPVQAAPKVVIGANLKEYKQPNKQECDILVPIHFSTIQAGIDAAKTGDTVCVGKGTFNENIKINKSLRLLGKGAYKSVIRGQITPDVPGWFTVFVIANNVTFEGFSVYGADGDSPSKDTTILFGDPLSGLTMRYNRIVSGNWKVVLRGGTPEDNHLIQNNIFEGRNSPFIINIEGLKGPSGKTDIVNNTFQGTVITSFPDSGGVLSTFATNSLVQRNIFNVGGTVAVLIGSAYASNIVSENNLNSQASVKIGTYSGGTLNAENNWWGDLDPSDNIQGDIDFTPFATTPFKQKNR